MDRAQTTLRHVVGAHELSNPSLHRAKRSPSRSSRSSATSQTSGPVSYVIQSYDLFPRNFSVPGSTPIHSLYGIRIHGGDQCPNSHHMTIRPSSLQVQLEEAEGILGFSGANTARFIILIVAVLQGKKQISGYLNLRAIPAAINSALSE